MTEHVQIRWKIEKFTYELGNSLIVKLKSRELIGIFPSIFEAETTLFDISGERVQYRKLKYFLRDILEENRIEDYNGLCTEERLKLYREAVNRCNYNNSTNRRILNNYGTMFELYRITSALYKESSQ